MAQPQFVFHLIVVGLILSCAAPAVAEQKTQLGTGAKSEEPAGSLAAAQLFTRTVEIQNKQQWDQAVSGWRNLLTKFPNDPLARQSRNYLGVCLLQEQKYDEAAIEFSRVVEDNRNDAMAEEAHLNLGLCYYSKGFENDRDSLAKAAKIFDSHVSKYVKGAFRDQALYYLAESLSMLQEHEKAAKYYQELIVKYPESPLRSDAMRAMAVGQLDQGQSQKAQSTFSRLAAEYPNDEAAADAKLQRAEAMLAAGNAEKAAELFTEVARENKQSADYALLRCGLCYEQAEQYRVAARTYEKLERQYPNSEFLADALLGAGRAYGLAQDTNDAEQCLTKIRTDNADTAMEIAHWRCRIQLFSGNAPAAAKIAEEALAQHEDAAWRVEVLLDRAEALSLTPKTQTLAAAKYLEVAKGLPDGELLWRATLGAADCLLQIQRFAEAERIAEAFLSAHADNEHRPAFQFIAAESERLQGHHDSAQQQFQELIERFPEHPMLTTWRTRLSLFVLAVRAI